jgi:hypothetical protein
MVHGASDLIEAMTGPWVEDQALGLPGDAVRILRALRRQDVVRHAMEQKDRTAGGEPGDRLHAVTLGRTGHYRPYGGGRTAAWMTTAPPKECPVSATAAILYRRR